MPNSVIAGTAWAPENSDFRESLTIDLGEIKNVTRIATRGRSHSQGFVKEFTISFGFNGEDYALFKENDGNAKVCFDFVFLCFYRYRIGIMYCS
jgi:hypothetical protein